MTSLRHYMTLVEQSGLASVTQEEWIEAVENGKPVLRVADATGSRYPRWLYRVMSADEYEAAKNLDEFRARPGQRIHASNTPHLRYGSGIDSVTVRFTYNDADGWRPKWGDELYAITDGPIPFERATVVDGLL